MWRAAVRWPLPGGAAAALASCGGGSSGGAHRGASGLASSTSTSSTTSTTSTVVVTSAPRALAPATAPIVPAPIKGLAIGLSEANADLLWSEAAAPASDAAFAHWKRGAERCTPRSCLVIDWAKLAPSAAAPPRLADPVDGCLRGIASPGLRRAARQALRAIASQQRAQGGFIPVIVIDGAPTWAAHPPGGCEEPGTGPVSRPLAPSAIAAQGADRIDPRSGALGRPVAALLEPLE